MEENTVKVDENEEFEPETEVDEATESCSSDYAFILGIVGGFFACSVIYGAKKLAAFTWTKWVAQKQKKAEQIMAKGEVVEVQDTQDKSSGEAPKS